MVPIDSLLQRRYRTLQAEHLFHGFIPSLLPFPCKTALRTAIALRLDAARKQAYSFPRLYQSLHITLVLGVLFARSSRLIPDKANLGFRFPCDGPGRGGTCQVSAWDHVFLGLFWMYNSISVVICPQSCFAWNGEKTWNENLKG
nr:photosystem I P700 chlorophyll A apoprotein A1 [Ipomoea batatas]